VRLENDIIGENLQRLHEASDSLGSAKMIETRLNLEVTMTKEERDLFKLRYEKIVNDFKIKLNDCDNMAFHIKTLSAKLDKVKSEKDNIQSGLKEQLQLTYKIRDDAIADKDKALDEKAKLEKLYSQALNEREKLRSKISKLKMKKKNVDLN